MQDAARVTLFEPVQFIAGIRLLNLAMDDVLAAIVTAVKRRVTTRIAFVNADCVNIAARDAEYHRCLAATDWVCVDGVGMKIAGRILGREIRDNVNGTDLFPRLCAELAAGGHSVYLLGARPGVAKRVAEWALARHPRLRVVGARSGYWGSYEEAGVIESIRAARPDVLLVAMGAPLQEKWLRRNLEATGATVGIGVGGLFDFYSGRIPRAPVWLRRLGGEWIFRLLQEPGRMWRRYILGNPLFLLRVLAEKLAARSGAGVRK